MTTTSTFACRQCRFSTELFSHLYAHEKLAHVEAKDFQCDYTATRKTNLLQHVKSVHDKMKDDFACIQCGYSCSSKTVLLLHTRAVHDRIKKKCPHCNSFSSAYTIEMSKHIRIKHKDVLRSPGLKVIPAGFACQHCNKSFTRKDNMRHHERKTHDFQCPRCTLSFVDVTDMSRHTKAVHYYSGDVQFMRQMHHRSSSTSSPNISEPEERRFITEAGPSNVQHHNTTIRGFKCLQCILSFIDVSSLLLHMQTVHNHVRDVPFMRPIQQQHQESSSTGGGLCAEAERRHGLSNASGENLLPSKENDAHSRLELGHDVVDPTQVDGTKSYACQLCNYSTRWRACLDRHVRGVHEKIRDFQCIQCDFASSQKGDLLKHVSAVHDKVRFHCQHCSYSSGHKQEVSRHVRLKHYGALNGTPGGREPSQQTFGSNSYIQESNQNFSNDHWQNVESSQEPSSSSSANAMSSDCDLIDLTEEEEPDDVKTERLCRQYSCVWCSSSNDGEEEKLDRLEMEAHLVENHSLTLQEYVEMNNISFS